MLQAPFPWFGGKSRAAPLIWARLGNVQNYVEPFAGSLAVLLSRPHAPKIETVNDKDAFVANVWRALQADPDGCAQWADWPSNEADMHARHLWLRERREVFTERLFGDPGYYDVQIAGWWLWGIAQWIGSGWCSDTGNGPWGVVLDDEGFRRFQKVNSGRGVSRQSLHLGNTGQGVTRKRLHLHRRQGVVRKSVTLQEWFVALQERLRWVRVACGDWERVMGYSVTDFHGVTGILLDPPYGVEVGRDMDLYREDSGSVAADVRAWCLDNGGNTLLRIVLCGYDTEHDALLAHGWGKVAWKANGGYQNIGKPGNTNNTKERLWCSPYCLQPTQWKQKELF